MISNDFTQKIPHSFYCEKCDFTSSNKKDYTRHLQTKNIFAAFRNAFQ